MRFVFDVNKSESNKQKHGISLREARKLWSDGNLIIGPATSTSEERWAAVGKIEEKYWFVVFTFHAGVVRLITCRRAREEEVKVYENSR